MSRARPRFIWFLLFVAGFIFGPLGDYTHILSQTTSYPQGGWGSLPGWPIPLWVPWEFGLATVAVGMTHINFERTFSRDPFFVDQPSFKLAIFGMLALLGQWAISGYLPGPAGGYPDAVMGLFAFSMWLVMDRRWQGILLGLFIAGAGTLVEITLVQAQIFSYHAPKDNLWGVPSWLPWLYFSASTAIGYFARFLASGEKRKTGLVMDWGA